MELLYFLEGIRNDVLDSIMLLLTHLGEETIFMAVAMFFLWCVDKYKGYYLLTVGFLGTQLNQLLKVTFRIPRPWVKDPNFTVVEGAVHEATGYSFPSGHTQSAVGTFGGLARWTHRKWLRAVCIAACVVVPFTRMYLGVHTPADVGVSIALALVLIFGLYPLIRKAAEKPAMMNGLLVAMLIWSVGQVLFMEFFPFPADANGEELYSGLKNAYKMLGAVAGFAVVYVWDTRYIRYETRGCWWVQLLKYIPGLLLSVGVKELLYLIPLPELYNRLVAYFLLVLFAGGVWPMTFRYIARLEKKK